jgi:hypothetical protein
LQAFSTRLCRHCGAALADGENEDECSSTFNLAASALRTHSASFTRSEWRVAPLRAIARQSGNHKEAWIASSLDAPRNDGLSR